MTPWPLWDLPFFDDAHRRFARDLAAWHMPVEEDEADLPKTCRAVALAFAERGLLDVVVPPGVEEGGVRVDVRMTSLAREIVSYESVLADAVLTMQGIGTAPIWLFGSPDLRRRYIPRVRSGHAIAAFALSEPDAGSDVAAVATTATRDGNDYVLSGQKTWISNAGIADFYVLVARTGEQPGARGLTAFLIDADTPGLSVGAPIDFVAAHPAASLTLDECRVPAERVIGAPGQGFKIAMATFDIFRTTVGAAAVGAARRALDETVARTRTRQMFGKPMIAMESVQTKLADMRVDLETAALTVYRAAWAKDTTGGRCTGDVSIAKLVATEAAQRVVDNAVQLFGGLGVSRGSIIEKLYREVRPMRIYEGASEVQKLIIARDLIASAV